MGRSARGGETAREGHQWRHERGGREVFVQREAPKEGSRHGDEGRLERMHRKTRRPARDPGAIDDDDRRGFLERPYAGVAGEVPDKRSQVNAVDRAGTVEAQVTRDAAARRQIDLEAQNGETVLGAGEARVEGCARGVDAAGGFDSSGPCDGLVADTLVESVRRVA